MMGSGSQGQQPEAIKAIRVQTSAYGATQTLAYGMSRVTGNLIWYGNFVAIAQSQNIGK
jgi:hypothetical protein